ncbi:MAG: DUF2213 domain-containing protein [Opitutaceae bacterium]
MERIVSNATGKVRRDTMHGREFLVVPLTTIVPGVLNGSKGALYYPPEEISRNADAWNIMPIVVNHPTAGDGSAISARNPAVLNKFGIGFVFNTQYKDKLVSEGWIDIDLVRKVEPRILANLEAGKPIELSTGLFTDNEAAPEGAVHNGKPYQFIARNYRPDHLAILPDQVGACSIRDGCGVLVNSDNATDATKRSLWQMLGNMLGIASDQTSNQGGPDGGQPTNNTNRGGHTMALTVDQKKAIVDNLIANCGDCGWKETDRELLTNLGDEALTKLQANAKTITEQKAKIAERDAVVNAARKGFGIPETVTINAMPAALQEALDKKKAGKEDEEDTGKGKATCNEMSEEDWMKQAPASIRSAITNAKAIEQRERSALIERLTANVAAERKEVIVNRLKDKPLDELRDLLALAPVANQQADPLPLYTGMAAPQTRNQATVNAGDILPLPTIDWSNEKRA